MLFKVYIWSLGEISHTFCVRVFLPVILLNLQLQVFLHFSINLYTWGCHAMKPSVWAPVDVFALTCES